MIDEIMPRNSDGQHILGFFLTIKKALFHKKKFNEPIKRHLARTSIPYQSPAEGSEPVMMF